MNGRIVTPALLSLAALLTLAERMGAAEWGDLLPFKSSGPTGSRPALLPWQDAKPGERGMLQRIGRGARHWVYSTAYSVRSGARTFAHRGWTPFWKRGAGSQETTFAARQDKATFLDRWFGSSEEPVGEPEVETQWMRLEGSAFGQRKASQVIDE